MTIKDIAFKSEELDIKTWSMASMIRALSDAIYHGTFESAAYEGAFYTLSMMAQEVDEEAKALTTALFDVFKQEPGGAA